MPSSDESDPYWSAARPPDSHNPKLRSILVGHVIATKSTASGVTDDSMDFPTSFPSHPDHSDYNPSPALEEVNHSNEGPVGHVESGRTLCIHSVGVLPKYQARGIGKTILKAYLQRMESSGIADRIALLAHDHLVKWYEALGFRNNGVSDAKFGGGGWYDMVSAEESCLWKPFLWTAYRRSETFEKDIVAQTC